MLDKFAPDAVTLIERATEHARAFGHSYIGAEHFLLAFVDAQGSPESEALKQRGLNASVLAKQVDSMFGRSPAHSLALRFNAEAKELLQTSWQAIWRPEAEQISARDIFKVLMREHSLTVNNILRALSASADNSADASMVEIIRADKTAPDAAQLVNPAPAQSVYEAAAVGEQQEQPGSGFILLSMNSEIPMAEGDFTEAANFALLFARIEAATFNFASREIDSRCLLVGLALERGGAAGKLLRRRGVTVKNIRGGASDSVSNRLAPRDLECLLFDTEVRRILRAARKESRNQRAPFVKTEHLLWAILSAGQSEARDILVALVDDVCELRPIFTTDRGRDYESTLGELDLNEKLFRILEAGESGVDELLDEVSQSAPVREPVGAPLETSVNQPVVSFNLKHLNPQGLAVMEAALREFSALRFGQFDQKHVFLGILAEGKTQAAKYLAAWGVTLYLARRKVVELEGLKSDGGQADSGKSKDDLDTGVSDRLPALLTEALSLAQQTDAGKAGAEHLLWALTASDHPDVTALIQRLGLEADVLCLEAADICRGVMTVPSTYFPKFTIVTGAGLHIYGMLCEPGVAIAMQIALNEAQDLGARAVTGEFLLLGLLSTPGRALDVLRDVGVSADTARGAIRQLHALRQTAYDTTNSTKKPGKKSAKNVPKSQPKPAEIDLDAQLEGAFFKALERSLQSGFVSVAVASEHLLWGLIESENPQFQRLLCLCGTTPLAVLEKMADTVGVSFIGNTTRSVVSWILAKTEMPVSSLLRDAFKIAADVSFSIAARVVDCDVLVFALSHVPAGSIADKLISCGLDPYKLQKRIKETALRNRSSLSATPHISPGTFGVLVRAAKMARELGYAEVQCEHLMMAILDDFPVHPDKKHWLDIGLNVESLVNQLFITGSVSSRAQDLKFGPELTKRVSEMDLSAKSVLINAGAIAATAGRNFIDTEQILLAIATCKKERLVSFLQDLGLNAARVEALIATYTSPVMEYRRLTLTFTWRLDEVFKEASAYALRRSSRMIGVEHLLFVILNGPGGVASHVLSDLNVDGKSAAMQLDQMLNGNRWQSVYIQSTPQSETDITASAKPAERANIEPFVPPDPVPLSGGTAASLPINVEVFDPETLKVFSAAPSFAEKYPIPNLDPMCTLGGAYFIEPCHFLLALLKMPDLARLVCLGAVNEKLEGLGGSLALWFGQWTPRVKGQELVPSADEKPKKSSKPKKAAKAKSQNKSRKSDESSIPDESKQKTAAALEFSPGLKALLTASFEQSRLFQSKGARILPEHLLLAILAEPDQLCRLVLVHLQVEPMAARLRILGYISDRDPGNVDRA